MKMIINNVVFSSLMLLVVFITSGCSKDKKAEFVKKNIQFSDLKQTFLKKDSIIDLKIITPYPNEEACPSNVINANLYVCKDMRKGDTLYVFQVCDKAAWFVEEYPNESFCVLSENVKENIPNSVTVLVPKSFRIPKKSNYIFSSITRLED